ncbi:hypothetical protein BHF71_06030 [Vulcanibacillus modesticaldus]|uniref:Beta propeller domain-containing protein n=1 Tax=Vulcanibacillus modesticaldus TaxID=337097 RepID=A0A1D2YWW6_9BACI|nr:beta-propeller domain-containing protein [Vulcanibacillus modesticaldus]OEG00160.1 hypothetical protein BHF71_06030 [Vulcanibacillus modesticaldus]
MKRLTVNFIIITILLTLSLIPIFNTWDKTSNADINSNGDLPVVGSYKNLKSILADLEKSNLYLRRYTIQVMESAQVMTANEDVAVKSSADSAQGDYSKTNVQVAGVDEADVIKTDGKYVYQVNNNRVIIFKAYPAEEMKIVSVLDYFEEGFYPRDIYVDDKYLVVIGNSYSKMIPMEEPELKEDSEPKILIEPPFFQQDLLKVIVYDIKDKNNISRLREFEMEGYYLSSRKIDSSLYLVSNKYLDIYRILKTDQEVSPPAYRDSLNGDKISYIDYDKIHYFPDSVETNYLIIAGINLDDIQKEVNITAFLGSGNNIYASRDNLYVTLTKYDFEKSKKFIIKNPYIKKTTSIYKFKLNNGVVEFSNEGKVPGTVLNQFSMDENNGFFRIATTTGEVWRTDQYTSRNNLYILDKDLKLAGKIEDIAPGERIYSVRFMGDRAYMVTFKTVDPLFVIDLKDPYFPKILGKLKIPGYSDYLHPYDSNHIIGFGKDTIELPRKDGSNQSMAYYQGMKIALFDVTDVNNPKEMFVEIIGDRGTYSELLYNHKALLFSKDKNLMAFPITVMEVKDKKENNKLQYGEFSFQGAYIYNIDLENGFQLRKRISHLDDTDYKKAGLYDYNYNKTVERIIYINDTLYTLSKGMIKANRLDSFEEINSIEIPMPKQY